jgi:hypothetical protein
MSDKDSSVPMSSQVKFIFFHFLESGIKSRQSCNCLFNKYRVSDWRRLVIGCTEAYSYWQLKVKHVSILVPRVVIELKSMSTRIENERPIFVEGAEETRAARAT